MSFLKDVFISMRPRQWYKNSLLFACVVFAGHLQDASIWAKLVPAALYFCLLTGCEYIINDILDRSKDREHPVKKNRPIASGRLSVASGFAVAFIVWAGVLVGAYYTVNLAFFNIAAGYLILILLYTLVLKHLIIADVLTIALGFVIRAVAGCMAIDVTISSWLVICTFLLAMFLALEKRWDETLLLADNAANHRKTLSQYSEKLLEQYSTIIVAATIVSYLLYTTLAEHYLTILTAPFVIYGLLRYMYLVHYRHRGGDPVVLFRDRALIINLGIWMILVLALSLSGYLA